MAVKNFKQAITNQIVILYARTRSNNKVYLYNVFYDFGSQNLHNYKKVDQFDSGFFNNI